MSWTYLRAGLIALWICVASVALYLFFFKRELLQTEIETALSASLVAGAFVYLFFGCIRGFTLIPSTTLVVVGIPFFPPFLLLGLTLAGILISAASIYLFSKGLHLDEVVAQKHAKRVSVLKSALQKYQLPVIIGWSFFPFAPTDLICYVCGALQVDFRKCLLGVAIGEGSICAIYIFLGDYALRLFELRF